ncbi:Kelch motif-containing protein [Nonomuraea solani]|uniref:Kelch motif-containing protein n=1 Tax=Nonomuraea solani TaxID=1144553 RepID=A0A1H5V1K3_9ACTN|nr:DUF6603 domain-containing protein [Nonomuraea solani]SEF81060.1 Kelch motif-containing protein [Nonomuraea solani]
MAEQGTFDMFVAEIGQALLPLRRALGSTESFIAFLQRLGWQATDIPQPLRDLRAGVDTLYDSLTKLLGEGNVKVGGQIGGGEANVQISADDVARALHATQQVIAGIRAIGTAPAASIPAPLRADGFQTVFPKQLVDYLIVTYLQDFHPSIGFALRSLGVIKATYTPQTGGRPPHMRLSLDLADLPRVLEDPSLVLKNAFGWGEAGFDFPALASQVDNLLSTIGLHVVAERPDVETMVAIGGAPPLPERPRPRAVKAVMFERVRESGRMAAEIRLLPLPAVDSVAPGLAVLPSFNGVLNFRLDLGPDIFVTIRSELDLQGGVAVQVRPGRPIELVLGFESGSAPVHAKGALEVRTERSGADGVPTVILGAPGSTRLQFGKIAGTGGIRLSGSDVDVFAEVELTGLEFVFEPSGADGFIAKIIPEGGFSFGADLTVGLSHREGFYFRGAAGMEIQLPVHLRLGPVEMRSLTISAAPSGDGLPIGLGATFKAELGPLKVVVEEVGLTAAFAFKSGHDGNLGPLDLSLGFRPPRGAGLSVDAGVVTGGGFLRFFPERGEYAGALELEFTGLFGVKALGLISTRMPDGSKGFSLLLVITAEFPGGIQLGFGFTLLAVGGLIGLNRRMNLEALAEGVRTGAIESVMFPRDVIANAPRILSDLNAFFPIEEGKFLIGPMAKIGWGTPALITVSVGVIIEIPGNIAIVGVLRCLLPDERIPLLALQVNFAGAIEFDKQRLWFFAELFDSHVLFMTIEGGMGLLVAWGDNPDLVVTVGGFHPSFKPPPLPFPVPRRLAVDILNRPGARIRVSGYFAITSNTVQFGARAEMVLGFDDFGIQGHIAFDALFRFSPFSFVIAVSAGVTLRAFGVGLLGIDLDFELSGPSPWRAKGRGSISLLFFEISADFDIEWGERRDTTLPPVEVLPLLAGEFAKLEGWETRLPAGGTRTLVTLRALPSTGDLVLHPLGSLFVRQRSIPLEVRLDRVGAQRPGDGTRFAVAPAPDSGLVRASVTPDKFAMAQFQDMDDAAKLSRPAYEDQGAGLELVAAQGAMASARVVRRSARYEAIVIDSRARQAPSGAVARNRALGNGNSNGGAGTASGNGGRVSGNGSGNGDVRGFVVPPPVRAKRLASVSPAVFGRFLQGSSTSRSPLSQHEATLRQPFPVSETVRLTGATFVIAQLRNNLQAFPPAALAGSPSSFPSLASALDALDGWIVADPGLAGTLHVVPQSDAAAPPAASGTWNTAVNALPATASWDSPDAAALLRTGRILVAGGTGASGNALRAAAVFDPVALAWSPIASLATARHLHTVTALADGRVLVAGGRDTGAPAGTSSAEIYDPLSGAWSETAMGRPRHSHTATVLPGGKVLVAGGTSQRRATAAAEIFDPATGAWSAAAPMTDARSGHVAVPLRDGRVLVIGGVVRTGRNDAALAYCEIFDPATGTWTPTGSLATPRAGHRATVLADGTVLVTGGDTPGVAPAGMSGQATGTADPPARPFDPAGLASAERYHPATGEWTTVKSMPGGRSGHHSVLLRSGKVLVVGGAGAPSFDGGFRDALVYDPGTDTWTPTGRLATGRSGAALAELPDGRVLVAGGRTRSAAAAPHPGTDVLTATTEILTP